MDLFTGGLAILVVGCLFLHYYTRSTENIAKDHNFSKFQTLYLTVYLLAMRKHSQY